MLKKDASEWVNTPELVLSTMRSIQEVFKSQNERFESIDKALGLKASKAELSSGLNIKSNISDTTKAINDIKSQLDKKVSFDEIQGAVAGKLDKTEFYVSF